ncbi:VrrA/YqfQ family protein [Pseudoneobacillus sp. C159]
MPIPLRPGQAMQGGYPPRMMQNRYNPGPPFGGGYNQAPPMPMQGPRMNRPMMPAPGMNRNAGNQGGGILSKILGRGRQQGGPGGGIPLFNRGASSGGGGLSALSRGVSSSGGGGGILQSLANPEMLNGFLNNTQTVLKTAQQFGPMIQQYGPLVRNIPSLWKLYRGLKDSSSDSSGEETEETTASESDEDIESMEVNPIILEDSNKDINKKHHQTNTRSLSNESRRSVPKLFI